MQSFTLMRNNWAQEATRVHAEELVQWIPEVLGADAQPADDEQKDKDAVGNLFDTLATGVALCRLVERCAPATTWASDQDAPTSDIICKYHANAKPGSFHARENVTNFLAAAKQLGLPEITLFTPEDIASRKNEKQVINCLLQLARKGTENGVKPPQSVQYEMDIDAARKEEPETEEEILVPGQFGLTDTELNAIREVFSQLDQSNELAVSKKDMTQALKANAVIQELVAAHPEFAKKMEKLETDDTAPTDLGDFLWWWIAELKTEKRKLERRGSVSKLETHAPEARPRALSRVVHDKTTDFIHLPYIPLAGDDIDAALAAEVNANHLDCRIRRLTTKDGQGGLYRFGPLHGPKVALRIVRGLLMVRDGSTWEGVVRYIQRVMAEFDAM